MPELKLEPTPTVYQSGDLDMIFTHHASCKDSVLVTSHYAACNNTLLHTLLSISLMESLHVLYFWPGQAGAEVGADSYSLPNSPIF